MAAAEGVDVEESKGLVTLEELEAGDVSWKVGGLPTRGLLC
jgi:hypothetical protein